MKKLLLLLVPIAFGLGFYLGEIRANRTISIETINVSPECWAYNNKTRVLTLVFGHRTHDRSTTVDFVHLEGGQPLEYNFGPGSLYYLNP